MNREIKDLYERYLHLLYSQLTERTVESERMMEAYRIAVDQAQENGAVMAIMRNALERVRDEFYTCDTAAREIAREALAAGSRRAKTPQAVECEASQSGPKGNAKNSGQAA